MGGVVDGRSGRAAGGQRRDGRAGHAGDDESFTHDCPCRLVRPPDVGEACRYGSSLSGRACRVVVRAQTILATENAVLAGGTVLRSPSLEPSQANPAVRAPRPIVTRPLVQASKRAGGGPAATRCQARAGMTWPA